MNNAHTAVTNPSIEQRTANDKHCCDMIEPTDDIDNIDNKKQGR